MRLPKTALCALVIFSSGCSSTLRNGFHHSHFHEHPDTGEHHKHDHWHLDDGNHHHELDEYYDQHQTQPNSEAPLHRTPTAMDDAASVAQ